MVRIRRWRSAALPGAVALALSVTPIVGCSSTPRSAPSPSATPKTVPAARGAADPEVGATGDSLADTIAATARSLLASPYRYSGDDPDGFDCSGFTKFVFAAVGITIPRTAARQASTGIWTPADELSRGDLVFFGRRRDRPFHVGLVVSEPGNPLTMIHASSSSGVVRTEITSSPYWLDRLLFGRRVLNPG